MHDDHYTTRFKQECWRLTRPKQPVVACRPDLRNGEVQTRLISFDSHRFDNQYSSEVAMTHFVTTVERRDAERAKVNLFQGYGPSFT